jgi:hypothetical protein
MHHPIVIAPLFVWRVDQHQRPPRRRRQQGLEAANPSPSSTITRLPQSVEILAQPQHLPAVQLEQPQAVLRTHRRQREGQANPGKSSGAIGIGLRTRPR